MRELSPYQASIWEDLEEMNRFNPTKEQAKAIQKRDRSEAARLGVTLNQYLYAISDSYRFRIANLLHSKAALSL
jgi:hypothetical protein